MGYITLSSGLTLRIPTKGTDNWADTLLDDTFKKISSHDHTGLGKGLQIAAGALASNAVTEAKILDGSVSVNKLAADAVTTVKILDSNVTAAKLASNAVTTAKILDSNVTNAKINDLAVTTGKLAADAATSSKIRLTNDAYLRARDAAGSADVDLFKLNASDRLILDQMLPLFTLTSWSPSIFGVAPLTVSGVTINYGKYLQIGNLVIFVLRANGTMGGTANNLVTVSLPVASPDSATTGIAATGSILDNAVSRVANVQLDSSNIKVYRDDADYSAAGALVIRISGAYFLA